MTYTMETILKSYIRPGLVLIPIATGIWIIKMYISSRRAFARVRILSIRHEAALSDHQAGCEKIGYLPGHVSFIPLASIFSMILPQVKYFNKRPPGWRNKYDSKKNRRDSLDTTQPSLE